MIILDTNVLSALMHESPDSRVVSWLDGQPRTSIWTTSITVLEVQFGLRFLRMESAGIADAGVRQLIETVWAGGGFL